MDIHDTPGLDVDKFYQDPEWDKYLLVRPESIDMNEFYDNEEDKIDLEDYIDQVEYCFSVDDIKECKSRLKETHHESNWAKYTLANMEKIDEQILKDFFFVSREANTRTYSEYAEFELEYASK